MNESKREIIDYCRAEYLGAISLINSGQPKAGCKALMELNFFIDSNNVQNELFTMYMHAFEIINAWDFDFEPTPYPNFTFNIPLPPMDEEKDQ